MRVAVICMNGFEEVEALAAVDVLRRFGVNCDIVGKESIISSTHNVRIEADRLLKEIKAEDYDAVVLPGGLPGATNLRDDETVINLVKDMDSRGKIVAAICAAPIVLEKAGLLDGRNFTAYLGYDKEIKAGTFKKDFAVRDGNVITSRGVGTSIEFAFVIAEALGIETGKMRDATLWSVVYKGTRTSGNRDKSTISHRHKGNCSLKIE